MFYGFDKIIANMYFIKYCSIYLFHKTYLTKTISVQTIQICIYDKYGFEDISSV
jgi:hypothetical protein